MSNVYFPSLFVKVLVFLLILPLWGCVSNSTAPEFQQIKEIPHSICTVAVLPFVNDTKYNQGGTIMHRIFSAQLSKNTNLNIVQEGDVRRVLRQLKIPPNETPTLEQTLIMADRLNIGGVIQGKIIIMEENTGGRTTEPRVALDVKLLDAASGKIILTSYKNMSGEDYRKVLHFGLVNTLTELANLVSQEIIFKWKDEGVVGCGER